MKRTILILILTGFACTCPAGYWGRLSSGLDMSYLDWEHGDHVSWSFLMAFGVRVYDDIYVTAKLSMPLPLFVVIGNQINTGLEVSYLPINPQRGMVLKTALGGYLSVMWPEHIIVVLMDGQTSEPAPQHSFDSANGLKLEALVSLGYRWDEVALWLDLGLDHRIMDVRRTVNGREYEGDYDFTGARMGISVECYL